MHDFFAANAADMAYESYFNLGNSSGIRRSCLPGDDEPNASARTSLLLIR